MGRVSGESSALSLEVLEKVSKTRPSCTTVEVDFCFDYHSDVAPAPLLAYNWPSSSPGACSKLGRRKRFHRASPPH